MAYFPETPYTGYRFEILDEDDYPLGEVVVGAIMTSFLGCLYEETLIEEYIYTTLKHDFIDL